MVALSNLEPVTAAPGSIDAAQVFRNRTGAGRSCHQALSGHFQRDELEGGSGHSTTAEIRPRSSVDLPPPQQQSRKNFVNYFAQGILALTGVGLAGFGAYSLGAMGVSAFGGPAPIGVAVGVVGSLVLGALIYAAFFYVKEHKGVTQVQPEEQIEETKQPVTLQGENDEQVPDLAQRGQPATGSRFDSVLEEVEVQG